MFPKLFIGYVDTCVDKLLEIILLSKLAVRELEVGLG